MKMVDQIELGAALARNCNVGLHIMADKSNSESCLKAIVDECRRRIDLCYSAQVGARTVREGAAHAAAARALIGIASWVQSALPPMTNDETHTAENKPKNIPLEAWLGDTCSSHF
jgi:hypothetical protein